MKSFSTKWWSAREDEKNKENDQVGQLIDKTHGSHYNEIMAGRRENEEKEAVTVLSAFSFLNTKSRERDGA